MPRNVAISAVGPRLIRRARRGRRLAGAIKRHVYRHLYMGRRGWTQLMRDHPMSDLHRIEFCTQVCGNALASATSQQIQVQWRMHADHLTYYPWNASPLPSSYFLGTTPLHKMLLSYFGRICMPNLTNIGSRSVYSGGGNASSLSLPMSSGFCVDNGQNDFTPLNGLRPSLETLIKLNTHYTFANTCSLPIRFEFYEMSPRYPIPVQVCFDSSFQSSSPLAMVRPYRNTTADFPFWAYQTKDGNSNNSGEGWGSNDPDFRAWHHEVLMHFYRLHRYERILLPPGGVFNYFINSTKVVRWLDWFFHSSVSMGTAAAGNTSVAGSNPVGGWYGLHSKYSRILLYRYYIPMEDTSIISGNPTSASIGESPTMVGSGSFNVVMRQHYKYATNNWNKQRDFIGTWSGANPNLPSIAGYGQVPDQYGCAVVGTAATAGTSASSASLVSSSTLSVDYKEVFASSSAQNSTRTFGAIPTQPITAETSAQLQTQQVGSLWIDRAVL